MNLSAIEYTKVIRLVNDSRTSIQGYLKPTNTLLYCLYRGLMKRTRTSTFDTLFVDFVQALIRLFEAGTIQAYDLLGDHSKFSRSCIPA
jgi:hypothetical protein